MIKPKRGGAWRGQGRKKIGDAVMTATISARVSAAESRKYKRLGGSVWVRQTINKAKEPGNP